MTAPLKIRPLAVRDLDQWLPLWLGYNAFYGRVGPTALDPAVTEATWSRFHDAYEPMYALVAEQDGELLGLTHYLMRRSTLTIAPHIYLHDLFTKEQSRGRGVARALVEEVYARARAAGVPRVYWHTNVDNHVARRLYDRIAEDSRFMVYDHSLEAVSVGVGSD